MLLLPGRSRRKRDLGRTLLDAGLDAGLGAANSSSPLPRSGAALPKRPYIGEGLAANTPIERHCDRAAAEARRITSTLERRMTPISTRHTKTGNNLAQHGATPAQSTVILAEP